MKKNLRDMIRYEPDSGAPGGSTPPPSTPPPSTPPPAAPPPSAPPAPPPGATTPAPPSTPPPSGSAPATPPAISDTNLLADEGAPAGTPPAPTAPPAEITPEAVTAFVDSIDLKFKVEGIDREFVADKAAVAAVAPHLMKLGATKEQVAEIVKDLSVHEFAKQAAMAKRDGEFVRSMIAKTKEVFGADLPAYIDHARRGGKALFGEQLWKELVSVPAFGTDHRIIAALAKHGRSVAPDKGTGGGGGGGASPDFVTAWTGKPGGNG